MFRSDPLQQPDAKISSSATTSGLMNILVVWQPTNATMVIIVFLGYNKVYLGPFKKVAVKTLLEDEGSIMN